MLKLLAARNLAVLEAAELELGPGLTVFTGETGAGKSILVGALGLALGQRADATLLRPGSARAEVTAVFELDPGGAAAALLEELALAADGNECVLRRVIGADGRTRAFVNDAPVTVATLRQLGERLVEVHGQHAAERLRSAAGQRELLDAYAGAGEALAACGEAHAAWHAAEQRLEEVLTSADRLASERERLRFELDSLAGLDLSAQRLRELEEAHRRAAHLGQLDAATASALELVDSGEPSVTTLLAQALRALEPAAGHDPALRPVVALLEEASVSVDEARGELARYRHGLDADPQTLAALERELADWHELARRHRAAPQALAAVRDGLAARLAELEGGALDVDALRAAEAQARAAWGQAAERLSALRARHAGALARAVSDMMPSLGMAQGAFEVALTPGDDDRPSPTGREQVEFRVRTNPDQPLVPLARTASGGELSRLALALTVIAARSRETPTLVFDEADSGIGGRVAEQVGRLLAQLGGRRQVLCVTHLPQVAALGARHVRVDKRATGGRTRVEVRTLDDDERIEEIARMLAGRRVTERSRAHARELLGRETSDA